MSKLRLPLVLAGIAVLVGLALWAGLPAIGRAFAILGVAGFAVIVAIHLPLIGLMAAAWWSIGGNGERATLKSFVAARLARDAVAEVLPFSQLGGFAAGVRVLSLTGFSAQVAARSLFGDLLMEFLAKLPYALAGLGLLASLRPAISVPSYIVLTLAVLVGMALLAWLCRGLLLRFVPQLLRRWIEPAGEGPLFVPQRLAPSGLMHFLGWVLGGLEAWVTLRLMGIPVTVPEALVIDSLATSLRTFGFFVPAALGVQEAAYVLVCGLFGLAPGVAIAFSLVRRARDLLLGLAGLGVWQHLEVRHGRPASPDLETATPLHGHNP